MGDTASMNKHPGEELRLLTIQGLRWTGDLSRLDPEQFRKWLDGPSKDNLREPDSDYCKLFWIQD